MTSAATERPTAEDALLTQLKYVGGVVLANTEGISHEESLVQPSAGGNCLNWVVGHMVATRSGMLALVGKPPVWDEEKAARYQRGGDPITGPGEGVLDLGEILDDFESSQEAILEGLEEISAEGLGEDQTQSLTGLVFHEVYHLGQTGLLRRMLGKDGAIQ